MSSPILTFGLGLVLLVLFGFYLASDDPRRKRIVGLVLTVFICAFAVESFLPLSTKIRLGLDLKGGTSFLMRLVTEKDDKGETKKITPDMLDQAVETIRKRVDQFGTSEPVISPQYPDRILVQIPGLTSANVDEARHQLQKVAKLEFKLVHPESASLIPQIEAGTAITPPGYRIQTEKSDKPNTPGIKLLVKQRPEMTGESIKAAYPQFNGMAYSVSMEFTREGTKQFAKVTGENVGNLLAIVLDGEVQSAPRINGPIDQGRAEITGQFTDVEVRNLASVLENPLQTPVAIDDTRSVSATLGSDSIRSGILAGLVGLLVVSLAVLIYYRAAGVIALVGLVVNMIILFGVMSLFNFVLTLPGIAGIILTVGMAVDANVLIYERLREELAAGKSFTTAIDAAFEKAFSAIFDANVTTLITAAILFWKATGPVKGFAVTLTVGVIASVFAALVVTRVLFSWLTHLGWLKEVRMANLLHKPNFDFLGKRKIAALISITLLLGSIAIFAIRGERNFGIDFRGGDLLRLSMTQPVAENDAREALKMDDVVVQKETSGDKDFLQIRGPFDSSAKITKTLQEKFPQAGLVSVQNDRVGAVVGKQLAINSAIALGLGMLGILVYVTLRFEFSFALGALVALIHDVVITAGVFSLFGREFSLVMVGAILTIAGYSINDTIVVYDRIREGLRSGRKGSVESIMNASINETLNRTILTGGATLFSMIGLYFLGGQALNDFAFAILIGILVGTYSSVYIASPVVLWWSKIKGEALDRQIKKSDTTQIAVQH
ncbi:MAG TPA: protein translocase subunit SecD [Chthoniobacterales bacterium]